ncbi:MAG: prolyl oligopeptidase family serine peptidase [Candidatus Eremiobacterota bacterium]
MFLRKKILLSLFLLLFLFPLKVSSQENESTQVPYMVPPKEIIDIADAPVTPSVRISPDEKWMVIMYYYPLQTIAEISVPELRLGGLRINPRNNDQSRRIYYYDMILKKLSDGTEQKITGLPEQVHFDNVKWSPDSNHIAFLVHNEKNIELWVADINNSRARCLSDIKINNIYNDSFYWVSDSKTIICRTVPSDRGQEPEKPEVPVGPVIQENTGKKSPARTYQDLLKNPYDESLFEYYIKSQITKITTDGKAVSVGSEGMITECAPSPDGKYILVETLKKPFSYLVPDYRFPRSVEIWDFSGQLIKRIADLPLADDVPISFDAVPRGPRSVSWRDDSPSTLYWVEAHDEGDPQVKADIRDTVYMLDAPFTGKPVTLISLETRLNDIKWCNDSMAIVWEYWNKTRMINGWLVAPGTPANKPIKLFTYSREDKYHDPGKPLLKPTDTGTSIMISNENILYFAGEGASPEGSRPFLDEFNVSTGKTKRLWQSEKPYYEYSVRLLEDKRLVTRREAQEEPPNYFVREVIKNDIKQFTFFPHPMPQFAGVKKQILRYKRNDGVELTATLYLPAGYSPKDGPLPMVMWAYPHEFKSADMAGQITISPYRFIRIYPTSPLVWLTQGYVVLDRPTMPIIGEKDEEPNDKYVEQLVASTKAAVDEVVKLGVASPGRIAIGGHSYGAFMTANLLAHTDLFSAGIACSGAYNRTLTPFGFQGEERTFWEAPNVYSEMSPFNHADKINEPILLVHGEADNNPGTFPIQSERLYDAIKGLGGTARLVILPCESHSYTARESLLHELWEVNRWLDKYVKRSEK